MADPPALFVFVTGAGPARGAPAMIAAALAEGWEVYTVATPNVALVTPPEMVYDVPGARPIRGYGQPPLDRFPFGTMLVAPCTFNTLNKLAHGIADTLATAMLADALGAGRPVFVAPAMNAGLWRHPQTAASIARLEAWGCALIAPELDGEQVRMASADTILGRLRAHFGAA